MSGPAAEGRGWRLGAGRRLSSWGTGGGAGAGQSEGRLGRRGEGQGFKETFGPQEVMSCSHGAGVWGRQWQGWRALPRPASSQAAPGREGPSVHAARGYSWRGFRRLCVLSVCTVPEREGAQRGRATHPPPRYARPRRRGRAWACLGTSTDCHLEGSVFDATLYRCASIVQ